MHEIVFTIAALWMTVLLVLGVVRVIYARSSLTRILALDMVVLILIALLVVYADSQRSAVHLDAALLLTVLSFVATLAACRYHEDGRPFS